MSEKQLELPQFISVRELAEMMSASPINVIKELMSNGIMANINQQIDFDTASIVAEEMGFEAIEIAVEDENALNPEDQPEWRKILAKEAADDLKPRSPVITMLGHVDHGKTSLLDLIRKANVVDGEAGGITQHIGAYQAKHEEQLITFLDTPGHAAFTAMRARGAQSTDIAILVVAADDGVMPQTREAADHAKAAGVPIIVAMNKMDLAGANPDLVKQQLSEIGLIPDDWDGDTMVIPVSAKREDGIEDLLEAIVLTSEDLDPKANPEGKPSGVVLEAKVQQGRGIMATVLVQNGTLKVGDTLLAERNYGRIRAMYDYRGKSIKEAGPSQPVAVAGMNGMPEAGDMFRVVSSEKHARKIVNSMEEKQEERAAAVSLDDFFSRMQSGADKTLLLIVKADVQGSLEPIVNSLEKIDDDEVKIEILRSATGRVTESDVMLASASGAIVLGFNVEIDPAAQVAAAREKVDVNTYSIIYKLLEDVEKSIKGLRDPVFAPKVIGRAEVRATFRVRGAGTVAGCFMRTGKAERKALARLIRDTKLMHEGKVGSLKHHAEDVREIKTGFEFGVSIQEWTDYQENDVIEFYVMERVD